MRQLISISVMVFICLSATAQRDTIQCVHYGSFGMNGRFSLTVDSGSINYEQYTRNELTKKYTSTITPAEWKLIVDCVHQVNLSKLQQLISPTNRREVDGAWYASVSITTPGHVYLTTDFDEGVPMKELKPLLAMIDKLVGKTLVSPAYEVLISNEKN